MAQGKLEVVLQVQATSRHGNSRQPAMQAADMTDRREKGLCFNCDEKFTLGHSCSRSFCIEVIYDDEVDDHLPAEPEDDPHVSLHALSGICAGSTMQLQVRLGSTDLIALVDSGLTHNFVRDDVVKRIGIAV
jgi:hypothetical protein